MLKINIDGAWNERSKRGGIGVVIRNDQGVFVAGLTKTFDHIGSPLVSEALAAREGALLATQRGFQNFMLQSDSLQIVTTLNDPSINLSIIGHINEDSKALIASITRAISTYIRRQANGCAHWLARYALLSNFNCTWNGIPSDLILDPILKDVLL
ncbi:ribonuclease H protein [Pyrus ussuriensis x Pyrus communis]|uniref:Ribonuclease H protein n=1 Tax=Pyrus ussuriensis x Pyrus communis TaxID=2448454 RepID=A0A5N5GXC2_9ROSA|nr:ribonuclease H protein [Pyrus ussuriensis x Pyrus communis]